jgi:hypothetical protein
MDVLKLIYLLYKISYFDLMEDNIKIPENVASMQIKHLPFLLELRKFENEEPTDADISRMNANFVGMPVSKMRRYTKGDNRNLFNAIVQAFGTYTQTPLPLELTYSDQTYVFISDFAKVPIDWHIDKDQCDFEETPVALASFCYIEKGFSYGQADEHDNVINPRSERNKVFSEQMPLSLYLDIQSFFLLSWDVLQKLLTEAKS